MSQYNDSSRQPQRRNERWESFVKNLVFVYLSQRFRQQVSQGKVVKDYILSSEPYQLD